VGGIGRRTGYNSASAFEGRFGRDYFHFMRSSWGASWLRRSSCSQDARARPRGVSDRISCSAAIWRQQRIDDLGGSPGSCSSKRSSYSAQSRSQVPGGAVCSPE
jgi:hypothetical protein